MNQDLQTAKFSAVLIWGRLQNDFILNLRNERALLNLEIKMSASRNFGHLKLKLDECCKKMLK